MSGSEDPHSVWKSFLSGGFGGCCLVLAGHPFDLVKVRMQTGSGSAMGITRQILAEGGLRGLYRGVSAPLAGVTPIFAINFWAYDVGKKIMRSATGAASDADLTLAQIGMAGAMAAGPTTLIMAPGERIKCILQVEGKSSTGVKYTGPVDVAKDLYRTGGLRSVFRGSAATLARDACGSFAYFGVYEAIKRGLTPEGEKLSPLAVLMGGGMAGVANWSIALPMDTVKSRLQTAPEGAYSGMMQCARAIIAEEGMAGLYRGVGPALLRAFPANAACFTGVEFARSVLDWLV
jgi:solute carrier family 25 carnitine/acylcarnitine transporter 20/29